MVCADLSWVYSLSLLSLGITLIAIGVAYALGQFFNNPQFNIWAKTEIFQVFVSFFIVILILFINDSFCGFKYSSLTGLSPEGAQPYAHPAIGEDDNVMDAAGRYLANTAYFIKTEMRAARALYGVSEEASRYSRTPCMPAITFCLYGTSGYSVRPYQGMTTWVQVLGLSLYTDTVSYLTVLIQMALLAFISGGGIMTYLPFAIIMRSLPFMRQFGGGLIAICIALFIIYPGLLVAESLFWNPYEMLGESGWGTLTGAADGIAKGFQYVDAAAAGTTLVGALATAGGLAVIDLAAAIAVAASAGVVGTVMTFMALFGDAWTQAQLENAIGVSLQAASISFLSATFLFSLNIIAIGASARELGRLLGQEVDLSRLMQVV